MKLSEDEKELCAALLQRLADDPSQIDDDERLKALIAKIHREGKKGQRRVAQNAKREADFQRIAATGMVQAQNIFSAPPIPEGELFRPLYCYICKAPFTKLHTFYHALCPTCAAFNYDKRHQSADLTGRVALITGGRIKIGFQTALRLLRDGARVILTTRFPRDAAGRFAQEKDFSAWHNCLQIYGLDLRQVRYVEAFIQHLSQSEKSLDILINNAAQTVKRPRAFYEHLLQKERVALTAGNEVLALPNLSPDTDLLLEARPDYPDLSAQMQIYFPEGELDFDGQQIDLRPHHSWLAKLDEVGTLEMLEVQLVNAIAPFLFNSKLKPLMLRSPFERRFIINVSAMEGQFGRVSKTEFHPHTNMAKAALNMMTRTSAADYARDSIYMNSVDTGWITDENPHPKSQRMRETQNFFTPLDIQDGAARLYDPIAQGVMQKAEPLYGHFLKDYKPHPW